MNITVHPAALKGAVNAIPSKSQAHRMLICAAFADKQTKIKCPQVSDDIKATVNCLNSFGSDITYKDDTYIVTPIKKDCNSAVYADCGESGSTLRFLIPVAGALGRDTVFTMHGRLPDRPLSPLWEELERHGMVLKKQGDKLYCSGKINSGAYTIDGGVSSQFISGLMFALPLLNGKSKICITGKSESAKYIEMTRLAVRMFGVQITAEQNEFEITGNGDFVSPNEAFVEGDWSNSAFWLCAAAAGRTKISVDGLNPSSPQGDKYITEQLKNYGCNITESNGLYTVSADKLNSCEVDGSEIPDLIPVIAGVAAVSDGNTHIYGASRLKFKESDRLKAVYDMLTNIGADIKLNDDGFEINGLGEKGLTGGTVDGCGDHRIVMTAAIMASACKNDIKIIGAQAVNKSYPTFWNDYVRMGGKITKTVEE